MSETQPTTPAAKSMDAIMALCKRRGFICQASEIYGGINGFWDYGPLGAQLKKNLRDAWWEDMVMVPCRGRRGPGGEKIRCVPLETCIIQHPRVWEASGHIGGFNDPMVDDKETKGRFRADQLHGIFFGESGNSDKFVKRLRRVFTHQLAGQSEMLMKLPLVTILATSAEEAASVVRGQAHKMLRGITLESDFEWFNEPGFVGDAPVLMASCRDDVGSGFLTIERVPIDTQTRVPDMIPSPYSGKKGSLTAPKQFNLMFISYTGAVFDEDNKVYLRPETAQGIFVNFKNVIDTTRIKIPFGIGNTGKSFRNEITPRNFTYRSREFEQAELEFFCHPDDSAAWYAFWRDFRIEWWKSLGLAGDNLRLREHEKDELSHYSTATADVEYRFPFTAPDFGELEGIAHRGCFDLEQHQKHSGAKLEYFDTDRGELLPNGSRRGERYLPHCIEPAAGIDRGALAIICEAYTRDESRPSPEIMRFHPRLAPIKAAVFPLVNKDGMPEVAERLFDDLHARFGKTGLIETDAKQSIGKRYARMDEAGCPFCFTIDGETLTNQTVTVRDRDTGAQERLAIDHVAGFLHERLGK